MEAQHRIHETVARDVARVLRGQAPQHALVRAGHSTGTAHGKRPADQAPSVSGETSDVLLPYDSWWGDGLPHPSHTSYRGTLPGLRDIIAAEGPITTDRLYNRYVRGAGYKRVTEPVRRKLDAGVSHLVRGQEVEVEEYADPLSEDELQRVVRRKSTAAVVVREIGDRDLYQVPLNEIAELLGPAASGAIPEQQRGAADAPRVRQVRAQEPDQEGPRLPGVSRPHHARTAGDRTRTNRGMPSPGRSQDHLDPVRRSEAIRQEIRDPSDRNVAPLLRRTARL